MPCQGGPYENDGSCPPSLHFTSKWENHMQHILYSLLSSLIPIGNRVGRTRRHRAVEKGFHTSKLVSKIRLLFFRGFKAGIPQTAESIRETTGRDYTNSPYSGMSEPLPVDANHCFNKTQISYVHCQTTHCMLGFLVKQSKRSVSVW